jgi:hypothetical protein
MLCGRQIELLKAREGSRSCMPKNSKCNPANVSLEFDSARHRLPNILERLGEFCRVSDGKDR